MVGPFVWRNELRDDAAATGDLGRLACAAFGVWDGGVMSTSQALAAPPWGTGAIVALNVGLFLVAGPADDYRLDTEAQRNLPSISRLLADVLRHGGIVSLAVVIVFLGPVGWRLERLIGGVGVASIYLVGGFFGGLLEVLGSSDDLAVVGATAGTTTLVAAWAQTHWRLQRRLIAPAVVLMAWCWAHAMVTPGNSPWGGMAVAIALGLYATKRTADRPMTGGAR